MKEAFALMWYSCEKCSHRERIWNSRDGVTPFCMICPSCGDITLCHTDWQLDQQVPHHKLHYQQKFWRNGTVQEALEIMQRRIQRSRGTEYEIDSLTEMELLTEIRNGVSDEFRTGWPMIDIQQE